MPTYTFYPDPSSETTSVDGRTTRDSTGAGAAWNLVRGAIGNTSNDTASTIVVRIQADTTSNQYTLMNRGIFVFDSSAITDSDTITDATVSLYSTAVSDVMSQSVGLTNAATASNTVVDSPDYKTNETYTTRYCDTDIDLGSITTSAYNAFALNATGLAAISKTGVTKFGSKMSGDIDNSEPTWSTGANCTVTWSSADNTGTSQDPKLVVNTTAAGASTFVPKIIIM